VHPFLERAEPPRWDGLGRQVEEARRAPAGTELVIFNEELENRFPHSDPQDEVVAALSKRELLIEGSESALLMVG